MNYTQRNYFYKYYNINGLKSTLLDAKRKWSSPSEFNDPYDNQFDLLRDKIAEEYTFKDLLFNKKNLEKSKNNKLIVSEFEKLFQFPVQLRRRLLSSSYNSEILPLFNKYFEIIAQKLNGDYKKHFNDTSIFCVTEDNNNRLMWTHYADSSRGAVIKFLALKSVDSPLLVAQPVRYYDTIPKINCFELFLKTDYVESLRTLHKYFTLSKDSAYHYEREWRVVTRLRDPNKKFECLPFAKEEISEIYLGVNMTEENKKEIVEIVKYKYPWTQIFQARKKSNDFGYEFNKISYCRGVPN